MFDEFITKGREYVHKVDRTTNRVVEKKYNKIYLRGRACIESVRRSLFQGKF
jgi:hypothetical protein